MSNAQTIGDFVSAELIASWRFLSNRVRGLPPAYRKEVLREISTDIRKSLSDLQEVPK
jgi:hypothetical protein